MRCFRYLSFGFALLVVTGCFHPQLRVRKEIVKPDCLPNRQLKTPDLYKSDSLCSEQFIAHWKLPKGQWQGAILVVQWRLADASVQRFEVPLESKKSYWHHSIKGGDLRKKGGIASYCVRIWRKGALIAETVHPMWVNPVPIFANSTG